MALHHATSGEIVCLLPDATAAPGLQSTAVFKSDKLEVMRLMLAKGKTMPAHKVAGDITLHCLWGGIDLHVEDQPRTLAAGCLVYLGGGVVHSLTATEDACVLVHVVLQERLA